jgi:hypothetical protein
MSLVNVSHMLLIALLLISHQSSSVNVLVICHIRLYWSPTMEAERCGPYSTVALGDVASYPGPLYARRGEAWYILFPHARKFA